MSAKPTVVPPHPAARQTRRAYTLLGALFGLAGLFMLGLGSAPFAVLLFALSALSAYAHFHYARLLWFVQVNNTAFQLGTRGQLEEAEALLATIPQRALRGMMMRAVALQRTSIALQRGKTEAAISFATSAANGRVGLFSRDVEATQRADALAFRGLAYAAKGELSRAEEDAAAAEATALAAPQTIARARLVRALVLSRADKQDDLATHLRDNAGLLLEHGVPRERALFRALRRMTRRGGRSVYREPAKLAGDGPKTGLAGWIETLAPEAAGFVEEDRPLADRAAATDLPPASIAEVRAIDAVRAKAGTARPGRGRLVALWAALVVMFLAIWQFLSPAESVRRDGVVLASQQASTVGILIPFAIALVIAMIAVRLAYRLRASTMLARARRDAALANVAGARKSLWKLVNASNAMVGATAQYELARLASADGSFLDVISFCEAGISRLQPPKLKASAADLLLPGLMTELAVAKAALGRSEEAAAELALLGRDLPGYAYLASSQVRVRLVLAASRGEFDEAACVARERTPELPIPRREELLADLANAATSAVSDDERERLAAEVDEVKDWLDRVAPRLRDAALGRPRVSAPRAGELEAAHKREETNEPTGEAARAAVAASTH